MAAPSERGKVKGVLFLVLTTVLWGTSFSFIKLSVEEISGFSYTFYRGLFSILILSILLIAKHVRQGIDVESFVKGVYTGIAYMLGLLLQGLGTRFVTPSTSAFITGLNTVHVHLYAGLLARKYGLTHATSLILALTGLYILTSPQNSGGLGELLVFIGSISWAAQIILVSKYSNANMLEYLYGMFTPTLFLGPYVFIVEHGGELSLNTILYLAYLAVACSLGATYFQVKGQKYVSASSAAIIFLLEPVFALIFSLLMGLEALLTYKLVGGGLIVLATYITTIGELRENARGRHA
ncbi:DMT family transporter [Thermosphaera chiliense]|uniref:DMT family transporter n=1 Tax=Thermosphaera chiliense TaxID=3402707 RepID=A0A7M1UTL0_9CREN|nr:DMT family transporter [Thermosphaera aggregans]QOR94184.1 DMT family transporter [Thermosphaera aggregans]